MSAELFNSVVKSTDAEELPELGLTATQVAGIEIFQSVWSDSMLTYFEDGCASKLSALTGTYRYLLLSDGILEPSYVLSEQPAKTNSDDIKKNAFFIICILKEQTKA